MFTGIIEGVGTVRQIKKKGEGAEIEIGCDFDLERTNIGESISVNGCCLTVTSRLGKAFWADVSAETLKVSTLGKLAKDDPVNLERALKVGSRLGGHFVQGHVDGVGTIVSVEKKDDAMVFTIAVSDDLIRYIVVKGSVAIDGVSLTVNRCYDDKFTVSIISHTKLQTTFMSMREGASVNLEVDIIGKYVEKLGFLDSEQYKKKGSKVTEEFLKKHGF